MRHTVALAAAAVLGILLVLAIGSPPRAADGATAADLEGQTVRLAGVARHVATTEGWTRFTVASGGAETPVSTRQPAPAEGAWVEAAGRLERRNGALVLTASEVAAREPPPDLPRPTLAALASDPAHWLGRPATVAGWLSDGALGDREGHRIALGQGPWPKAGAVRATGVLSYAASCACYRFDAAEAVPAWTR